MKCTCQIFALKAKSKCHLVTTHLKELKVGKLEVSNQTWENRYTHFGAENVQGDKMFVL